MFDQSRVLKELKDISKDVQTGVKVVLQNNSLQKLTGYFPGPKDTPYEDGVFQVDIALDENYPFTPPKMRFVTKVWHPNVSSQNGAICLDILKDQWSPALTLRTALLSLQSLLASPQPNDPQDGVVANQFLSSYSVFAAQAKKWTDAYASPSKAESKVLFIMEMGFDRESAVKALEETGYDENAAVERLLR
uniref:E2 ubiquitin-conjugating enzyme n=1 Tax=Polytomella parva TaxID=51329 RepID=A0A7S0V1Z9_9CHLO|mmetsp:Transcript_2235/g.3379  ORF Transcript_2235/g.3379 Transcript_2235/m.3379 type:complete len:191 (+) Transcript_2235:183-755(+)|eukprot:CAMPEP_0175074500 /NCGR_PEP_ID=MMETSP0052_2-20121109/21354_1 /TAXON_ID=51329 ORGANISM="Polytomella parva, Strain SAG 63-3" /NCGR_SAMPLE_ID=MMETSP0052_2 /ASSEMBLY_ACC=CAM_ASM_000194 /LENGTH=190 /DNA_ID=CAMNT_0016342831 /DNA_START=116 /DNA_END=688 /DNA_ORIENTATION=-